MHEPMGAHVDTNAESGSWSHSQADCALPSNADPVASPQQVAPLRTRSPFAVVKPESAPHTVKYEPGSAPRRPTWSTMSALVAAEKSVPRMSA